MPSNPIMWPSVSRKTLTVIPPFSNPQPTRLGRYDAFRRGSPSTGPQGDGGSLVREPSSSNALPSVHYLISRENSIGNVLCFQAGARRGPAECVDEGGELGERRRQGSRQGLSPDDAGARSCKLGLRRGHLKEILSYYADDIVSKINKQTNSQSPHLHKAAQRGVSIIPALLPCYKNMQFQSLKALQTPFLPVRWMDRECYSLQWKQGLSQPARCGSHQMTEHLSRSRCSPTPVRPAGEVVKRTTPFTRMRTICHLSLLAAWKHGL